MRFNHTNFGHVWMTLNMGHLRWRSEVFMDGPVCIVRAQNRLNPSEKLQLRFNPDGSGEARGSANMYGELVRKADKMFQLRESIRIEKNRIDALRKYRERYEH